MIKRILTIAALSGSCTTPSDAFVNPHEATTMVQRKGAVLVDVREVNELSSGMATGALWIPTSKVEEGGTELDSFISGLDASRPVLVYCAVGGRAALLVDVLRKKGFKANNMGGFKDWADAGLPVTMPDASLRQ